MKTKIKFVLSQRIGDTIKHGDLKEGDWFIANGTLGVVVDGKSFYPYYMGGNYRSPLLNTDPSCCNIEVQLVKSLIIKESCRG